MCVCLSIREREREQASEIAAYQEKICKGNGHEGTHSEKIQNKIYSNPIDGILRHRICFPFGELFCIVRKSNSIPTKLYKKSIKIHLECR